MTTEELTRSTMRVIMDYAEAYEGNQDPSPREAANAILSLIQQASPSLGWREMESAPKGVPIVVRHTPTDRMPNGWVGTVRLSPIPDEHQTTYLGGDDVLHYNGDALVTGFRGCYDGWLPLPDPDTGFAFPEKPSDETQAAECSPGDTQITPPPYGLEVNERAVEANKRARDFIRSIQAMTLTGEDGGGDEPFDPDHADQHEALERLISMAREIDVAALPHMIRPVREIEEEVIEKLAHCENTAEGDVLAGVQAYIDNIIEMTPRSDIKEAAFNLRERLRSQTDEGGV